MPPSISIRNRMQSGSPVVQAPQPVQPPSGQQTGLKLLAVAILVFAAAIYFRPSYSAPGPGPKPTPDQHDDKREDAKPSPSPSSKKFEGKAVFLAPRSPMPPNAAKMLADAAAYRDKVGKDKFDYRNPDTKEDKSDLVIALVNKAQALGKSPPCVLWAPSVGKETAVDWPQSFEAFMNEVTK